MAERRSAVRSFTGKLNRSRPTITPSFPLESSVLITRVVTTPSP